MPSSKRSRYGMLLPVVKEDLSFACPSCGLTFTIDDINYEYRDETEKALQLRVMRCSDCEATLSIEVRDLKEAVKGPLESLPLLMNSVNPLVQAICAIRFRTGA